jgi:predicted AAA+ superfamily ATPase
MYIRFLEQEIIESLSVSPVVLIRGARYSGKTTLAKSLQKQGIASEYITLDSPDVLIKIEEDVETFLKSLPPKSIIDEVQRIPHYFHVIKKIVDEYRDQGNKGNRFILTGSANIFLLPKLSESLAGRMTIFTMRPLSQGEIENRKSSTLDLLFQPEHHVKAQFNTIDLKNITNRIFAGGYPDVISYTSKERNRFFDSYTQTLLERDIRNISNIEQLHKIPTILRCISHNIGNIHNTANLARDTGIKTSSLKNYLAILKALYLIEECPAWTTNHLSRVIKSPKYYLCDTALAIHIAGLNEEYYLNDHSKLGSLLENFVYQELLKQLEWSKHKYKIFYFRNEQGKEVDFIVERQDGKIISLEIKASNNLTSKSLKGLNYLKTNLSNQIIQNYILYTGEQQIVSKDTIALPLSCLWQDITEE